MKGLYLGYRDERSKSVSHLFAAFFSSKGDAPREVCSNNRQNARQNSLAIQGSSCKTTKLFHKYQQIKQRFC